MIGADAFLCQSSQFIHGYMLRLSSHRFRSCLSRLHRYPLCLQRRHVIKHYFATFAFMAKATVADIVSHLSSLNITPGKLLTHESSTSPSSWRDALAKSSDVPRSYQLVKSLVFKPKTSKTAPQTLLVVFAREETETSSAALGKKFNLKDLRLAPEDLLNSLFGVNKDASACALMLKSS
jgi:hypothetical protein